MIGHRSRLQMLATAALISVLSATASLAGERHDLRDLTTEMQPADDDGDFDLPQYQPPAHTRLAPRRHDHDWEFEAAPRWKFEDAPRWEFEDTPRRANRDLAVEQAGAPHHARIAVSLVPLMPSVMRVGQPFAFELAANSAGYAHLYVLDASGKVQVWLENVPIDAGETVRYPLEGTVVRASPPGGDETIVLVVTRTRFNGFLDGRENNRPFVLPYSRQAFHKALLAKTSHLRHDWGGATLTVRVKDDAHRYNWPEG